MTSLDIRAEHRQTQTLSPRLQHAVRLLQMSSLDFAAMLRETLGKNPFLEVEDGEGGDPAEGAQPLATGLEGAAAPTSSLLDGSTSQEPVEAPAAANDGDLPGALDEVDHDHDRDGDSDRDLWAADGSSGQRRAEEGELSALDLMAVETALNDHLHGQLNVLPLPERDLLLARAVVESLDDDGYLRTQLEELIDVAELDPPADLQEMQIALKRAGRCRRHGVGVQSPR